MSIAQNALSLWLTRLLYEGADQLRALGYDVDVMIDPHDPPEEHEIGVETVGDPDLVVGDLLL